MLIYKLIFPRVKQKEDSANSPTTTISIIVRRRKTTKSGSDINPAYIKFGRKFAIVEADLLEDVNENW